MHWIDRQSDEVARESMIRCCASTVWVEQMLTARPFGSESRLLAAAEKIWQSLAEDDWLEAFAAHPRIGDLGSLRQKFADTASLAAGEQAGAAGADDETLAELAAKNRAYEARFGYIFVVCATGKSASEMLQLLTERLHNAPEDELTIAAAEQFKITSIRLRQLPL